MSHEWPDIPRITTAEGRPQLPREPEVVLQFLRACIDATPSGGAVLSELVESLYRQTRSARDRLHGLAGWLPVSRVAAWAPDGRLRLHPDTDLVDLALRFGAWIRSRPAHPDHRSARNSYAAAVEEGARSLAQQQQVRLLVDPAGAGEVDPPTHQQEPQADAEALVPAQLTEKIRGLLESLDAAFVERRTHTRGALLALLAGQHVLLLGPPGTAKSLLARALCRCFKDSEYFEYLLSRFTHPDELFGPVSIPGLKNEDYRRITAGFLPTAHVAFLDEIFKANSAILNSLLTLVNERVFHHGRHRDAVPLLGVLGASNELPDAEGGLAALYDRFLVRMTVPPVVEPDAFLKVASGDLPAAEIRPEHQLTEDDLRTIQQAAHQVRLSPRVEQSLVDLWTHGHAEDWAISDRRWRQAVHLLKVAAATDGRREVSHLDLLLLQLVLPPTPDRATEVRDVLLGQLGASNVPQHDLRAQWHLLRQDRVAGAGLPPVDGASWSDRLAHRSRGLAQFVGFHRTAVETLAADRTGIEGIASRHLWIDRLPPPVLAAHITASRDLSRILKAADAYALALASPETAAKALLDALPKATRRAYGQGAVCTLKIGDATAVSLTLAGTREARERVVGVDEDGLVRPAGDQPPEVVVTVEGWADWLASTEPAAALVNNVPAWATRNASTALQSARTHLEHDPVPPPPTLPEP